MKLLKEALSCKEGVVSLSVTFFGSLLCFIGGNFIKGETASFMIVIIGAFISISGTTEFAKVIRTIRDQHDKK